jgi:ubiquinone/menaquinone biosynthesis C-methylase UbiE
MEKNSFIPALKYHFLTKSYDRFIRLFMPEKSVKKKAVSFLKLRSGDKLLDFGCGTGTLLELLNEERNDIRCVGYDVDEEILGIAKSKDIKNTSWVLGQEVVLPFPDQHFDKIVSTWVFHHLENDVKEIAFRQLNRVLKPGGIMIVADWGKPYNFLMRSLFFIIQLADNFYTTSDNVKGRLPEYMRRASFKQVEQLAYRNTLFGTLAFYRAIR